MDETEPVDIPQYAVPAEYRVLRKLKGKNKKVCSTQDRDDIQGPMKRQEGSSSKIFIYLQQVNSYKQMRRNKLMHTAILVAYVLT